MALLTLQQVFGSNATQNATTVTFLKGDLQGLTPQTVNTADSIFAGIVNNVWQQFEGSLTDQNGITVTDQGGTSVTYDNHLYYDTTKVQFWGYSFPSGEINSVFIISEIVPYEN
ncbi:MAG: hypothetical protein V7L26_30075 [Nostoc sp.]|uniref:hypothetical protein n=1 Tax=Nostoc sp. TaxID=1180 RepID=UPI002FF6869C